MKTDTKFLFTLQRNINKLFESKKNKLASIPDEPDACIQFHGRPYFASQEITPTKNFDILTEL